MALRYFDSFFGGSHGGRGAAQRTRSDMGIRLSITLEEAARSYQN